MCVVAPYGIREGAKTFAAGSADDAETKKPCVCVSCDGVCMCDGVFDGRALRA
jgi:hypothetical protein